MTWSKVSTVDSFGSTRDFNGLAVDIREIVTIFRGSKPAWQWSEKGPLYGCAKPGFGIVSEPSVQGCHSISAPDWPSLP